MSLFKTFTFLAILVSAMGLYGLVSLVAVQRIKEIGVRKVLGASLRQIFSLLSGNFIKAAIWALVIALPVAGMVMNNWLSGFAYHVNLQWTMFLYPAIIILFITLMVISRELMRTALINPAISLRTE